MGFLFKHTEKFSSNNKMDDKYPFVRFRNLEQGNLTSIRKLQKLIQLEYFGFEYMIKTYDLHNFIKEKYFGAVTSFFHEIAKKYNGHNFKLREDFRIIGTWSKASQAIKQISVVKRILATKYVTSEINKAKEKEQLVYYLNNLERILTKSSKKLVEQDYIQLEAHKHHYPCFVTDEVKVRVRNIIIKDIVPSAKQTVLSIVSLTSFHGTVQSRLKWNEILRRINTIFKDINPKYHRHVIIITDSKILEERLLEIEKNNENLDAYWPHLGLGRQYEDASEKIQMAMNEKIMTKIPEDSSNCVSILFAELSSRQAVGTAFEIIEACCKELLSP